MNDRKRIAAFILSDLIFSLIAWILFNILRYYSVGADTGFNSLESFLLHGKAIALDIIVPCFWIALSALSGYYHAPRKKSAGTDLLHTLVIGLSGTLLIFFTVIINDLPESYTKYYELIIILFVVQMILLIVPRTIILSRIHKAYLKGKCGIPTLIIGSGKEAARLLEQFQAQRNNSHDLIVGCIATNDSQMDAKHILGNMDDLANIIQSHHIEHLIVALDNTDESMLQDCLNQLYRYRLEIHAYPFAGKSHGNNISLNAVNGIPLRRITPMGMQAWELNLKRLADILLSCLGLLIISPLMLYLMLRVKLDSKGPVFFTQERLGRGAKPFKIIKFRTMFTDAEANGPQLSSANDKRITPFGAFMRRYRLDELPQFINVIKGDMSLVGPRPERPFYATQILEKAPYYELVYSVRPGITSLGMAKYGYANNVEKMIQRLDYDIIYLSQASLLMDLKILAFTIKPLVSGSGV